MNIYKVSRTDTVEYDEYSSLIVVSETEDGARKILPYGALREDFPNWTKNLSSLHVELLGKLDPHSRYKNGDIIHEDYNAG